MKRNLTRSNNKYTYKYLQLRKRILRQEIKDLERIITLEDWQKTLGIVSGNLKQKSFEVIQNPSGLINLAIDLGLGYGGEKIVSRFVNKKKLTGRVIALASSVLIPIAINTTKKIISRLKSKKQNQNILMDVTDISENIKKED